MPEIDAPGRRPAARLRKQKLDTKIIHSLNKGLEVLEMVATDGEAGLSDLSRRLKWDKSTIFRLLTTLIRRGYVEQDPDTKRYRLGYRILHLEQYLFQSLDLPRLSKELLKNLANATGEASHLAALHGNQVIVIAQHESPERVAVNAHVGTIEPLHCTALGKAILMQFPEEDLKTAAEAISYRAYTPGTLTSPEALIEEIVRARRLGYAIDDEEYTPEVRCVAAPALIPGSRQFYAVGISGPSSRLTLRSIPKIAGQVRAAAKRFTDLFGGPAQEKP